MAQVVHLGARSERSLCKAPAQDSHTDVDEKDLKEGVDPAKAEEALEALSKAVAQVRAHPLVQSSSPLGPPGGGEGSGASGQGGLV